jgi:hypothetical protein
VSIPISRTEFIPGTFTNVQYVPDLKANLLSVSALTNHNIAVTFLKRDCLLRANDGKGRVIGRAERVSNKLYRLTVKHRSASKPPSTAFSVAATTCPPATASACPPPAVIRSAAEEALELWRQRLGHVHHAAVPHLIATPVLSASPPVCRFPTLRPAARPPWNSCTRMSGALPASHPPVELDTS